MSANKRIFYPTHQVGIKANETDGFQFSAGDEVHGVQSFAMSTNFNLEPIFQLGSLQLYENREDIPDVEVTLNKILDGNPLMLHLATQEGAYPTLVGRSTARCIFGASIFSDTSEAATGTPLTSVACSGMFVNSAGYTFGTDGPFTEDITLVGNNKVWYKASITGAPAYGETDLKSNTLLYGADENILFDGAFTINESPAAVGGVQYSEDLIWAPTGTAVDTNGQLNESDVTTLPPEVDGISDNGQNEKVGDEYNAHVSSISVSVDLGREQIDELGRRGPYTRIVTFPVEVTCDVEATAVEGDLVSATEDGVFGAGSACADNSRNLNDRTIRVATCDGTRVYLGTKNKLASVNYSGGDAGGGNVTVSYSFSTYNDFTIMHSGDPTFSWAGRDTYLTQ